MLRYIIKRLVSTLPVLFIIATITFFIMRLAPGGPFDSEKALPPEILETINKKYHFDEPLYKQYFRYMKDVAHLDFGPSFKYANRSVTEIIPIVIPKRAAKRSAQNPSSKLTGKLCRIISLTFLFAYLNEGPKSRCATSFI